MTIWMYVDPYASMFGEEEAARQGIEDDGDMPASVVLEYRELEALFAAAFADKKIVFRRNMPAWELKNGCPDFYLFDVGGMCASDYSGHARAGWCGHVLQQLEDHPSTGFIPWSMMTRQSMEVALDDLILGDAREVPDDYKTPTYPNLFMLDSEAERACLNEQETIVAWMRKFHGDRR